MLWGWPKPAMMTAPCSSCNIECVGEAIADRAIAASAD